MDESKGTPIILVIIFLVLVGSLVGIAVTIYSVAKTAGGIVISQRSSNVPSVFTNPVYTKSTPTPAPVYKFDRKYIINSEQEGAYRLVNGGLSYKFKTFRETDLDRSIQIKKNSDMTFYSDLIKKHINYDSAINKAFKMLSIPRLKIFTTIFQDVDIKNGLQKGWWMLPSIKNTNGGEKIILCNRNIYQLTDMRSCFFLNKVIIGDYILIYSTEGKLIKYKVISTDVIFSRVDTILRASSEKYLRIITSSDSSGGNLNNSYRIVILAAQVH